MSLEDLEQAGILLPRKEWGTRDIHTEVAKTPLVVLGSLVPVSATLMYVGNGNWVTWIGLGLFFAQMVAFTWLSLRGIQ
ncbi:MAG: hypothetical protein JXQ73_03740 [Phycisphaerae bacterium]|nr:hypothetical protein [Phycisphaerae bacterium]